MVSDPEMLPRWNPKVVHATPASMGDPRQGYRYRVTHRFGRRIETRDVIIESFVPPASLRLRLTGGALPSGASVVESWQLERVERGTRVTQTIDMSQSGMALPWRILLALLHRMGRPVGHRYLDVLRLLIEGEHLPARGEL